MNILAKIFSKKLVVLYYRSFDIKLVYVALFGKKKGRETNRGCGREREMMEEKEKA